MVAAQPELGSPGRPALRTFPRNRAAVFGLVLLSRIVLMTLFGSFFYDQDPSRIVARPLQRPGEDGAPAFGTDHLGRDVHGGVVNRGSTSLTVALVAVFLVVVVGVTSGALAEVGVGEGRIRLVAGMGAHEMATRMA